MISAFGATAVAMFWMGSGATIHKAITTMGLEEVCNSCAVHASGPQDRIPFFTFAKSFHKAFSTAIQQDIPKNSAILNP